MLDEVLNTTRMFGIVCERENVEDEVHMEHPFGVATAGLIRVSKSMTTELLCFTSRY